MTQNPAPYSLFAASDATSPPIFLFLPHSRPLDSDTAFANALDYPPSHLPQFLRGLLDNLDQGLHWKLPRGEFFALIDLAKSCAMRKGKKIVGGTQEMTQYIRGRLLEQLGDEFGGEIVAQAVKEVEMLRQCT